MSPPVYVSIATSKPLMSTPLDPLPSAVASLASVVMYLLHAPAVNGADGGGATDDDADGDGSADGGGAADGGGDADGGADADGGGDSGQSAAATTADETIVMQ